MSPQQRKRQSTEPEDEPIVEVSLEELEEATAVYNRERDAEGVIDTQHSDGSTTNPVEAQEQGLVYTPPHDPPVVPSDDLQGAEIGAGFANSMEESNTDVEDLPARIDNNDLDLQDDVATELRINSETSHLDDVTVRVSDGIVYLHGTVFSNDDIAIVDYLVRDLEDVIDVVNELSVAERA